MRLGWLALCGALCGCDVILGLDPIHAQQDAAAPGDVAPGDAVGDDAGGPVLACPAMPAPGSCRTIRPILLADTYLEAAKPDAAFGMSDIIRITDTDPGLFKFKLAGDSTIQPGECLDEVTLTLTPAVQARGCASGGDVCEPCATSYEGAELHWMTSVWQHLEATYLAASSSSAWGAPGASQVPIDRSPMVITSAAPGSATQLVIVAHPTDIAQVDPALYVTSNRIALQVVVLGGSAVFESFEGATAPPGTGCDTGAGTSLALVVCQP